jgi:beta-lactamase superfamily II metal-dependent hydrolase
MAKIHFLNVLDGDCNIIQHDSGRISVIDVSNAYNETDSAEEKAVKYFKEKVVKKTNFVPDGKINYYQKEDPDNPIEYIRKLGIGSIFRFIITHPDMDHLDGINDFYSEFSIANTWDTENNKQLDLKKFPAKYNPEDWRFYTKIRDGIYTSTKRLTYHAGDVNMFYKEDNIKILCPTPTLVKQANEEGGDIHDLSYVILFTAPKKNGGEWKIIFSGDSHDNSWEYIIKNYKNDVSNIDILFAPHHGRDSDRSYEFLKTLTPSVTLLGNASSEHLAYSCYPKTRITNNQAGYVVMDINEERILFLVKNKEFADNYRNKEKRKWGEASYYRDHDAYGLFQLNAK